MIPASNKIMFDPSNDESYLREIGRVLGLALLWLGTVKLADVQILVSIFSGLAVAAYSVLRLIALWRQDFSKKVSLDDN